MVVKVELMSMFPLQQAEDGSPLFTQSVVVAIVGVTVGAATVGSAVGKPDPVTTTVQLYCSPEYTLGSMVAGTNRE